MAAALAAAACTVTDPAASSQPQSDPGDAETAGAVAPEDNRFASPHPAPADMAKAGGDGQAAAAALCRITYGDESKAKAGLKLQGRVGDISLYAEPGGLLCSEPAGLKGDCQVVKGKVVVIAQAGKPDARIEALSPAPYMIYGPDGVRCAPPPPPVR